MIPCQKVYAIIARLSGPSPSEQAGISVYNGADYLDVWAVLNDSDLASGTTFTPMAR
jgi:hypothetical protein